MGSNGNQAEMISTVEWVTPERAAQFLECNVGNRRVRQQAVDLYAADMKAGRWRLHHQGIAFDCDGRLVDGQHRLMAILQSGVVVSLMVSRNVDRATFTLIDHGRKRDAGDALQHVIGEQAASSKYVAGVIRAAIGRNRSQGGLASSMINDDAVINYYRMHSDVITALIAAFGNRAPAAVTACGVAAVIDDVADLRDMIEIGRRFRERDFNGKDDPLNRLHALLSTRSRLNGNERYRYSVTALNAAMRKRSLGILQPSTRDWLENPGTPGRRATA